MKVQTIIRRLGKIRTSYNSARFSGDTKKSLVEKLGKMNKELYELIQKLKNENKKNIGNGIVRRSNKSFM